MTDGLTQRARHLLGALAQPGASAREDAVDVDFVAVRLERGGVSVGGGRFPKKSLAQLHQHDLVGEHRDGSGGRAFAITEAGTAHLRRRSASGETAFLAQHQEMVDGEVVVEGVREKVLLDAAEGPLDWLRRRKDSSGEPLIDAACYTAGERLRRDLTLAMMIPRVTTNWDASATGGTAAAPGDPAGASDASLAARQRVTHALVAVGPDFADLLIDVCGFGKGMAALERDRDWPSRSAKVVVKLALARLADHYGLAREARGPAHSRGIQAWQAVVLEGDLCGP